jgi:hypothetical protein
MLVAVEEGADKAREGGEEAQAGCTRLIGLHESCSEGCHRLICCFSDDNIILILYFE